MRTLFFTLLVTLGAAPAPAADSAELLTAPDAILCLRAENLEAASLPDVARSQLVLRAMGCLRSEAGVRTRIVRDVSDGARADAWKVRFYPQGISGGVVLWGKPSSFTSPDGSKPGSAKGI